MYAENLTPLAYISLSFQQKKGREVNDNAMVIVDYANTCSFYYISVYNSLTSKPSHTL